MLLVVEIVRLLSLATHNPVTTPSADQDLVIMWQGCRGQLLMVGALRIAMHVYE
jgi:hypothetical protein